MRKFFTNLYLISICVVLSSCELGTSIRDTDKYSGLNDEQQLLVRAQERWDALIKMELERVYEFATPNYRSTHDLQHFKAQYGGQLQRKTAEVIEVRMDEQNDSATVLANVTTQVSGFPGSGPIDVSTIQKGKWMKADGLWWHLEPR